MDNFNGGNFYPSAFYPIPLDLNPFSNEGARKHLDELMQGKDDIDKEQVMCKLDQFSCREELERYVENLES